MAIGNRSLYPIPVLPLIFYMGVSQPGQEGDLSGAQGSSSFMRKGGSSAGHAVDFPDPAFLSLSSSSRPGFGYQCKLINLMKRERKKIGLLVPLHFAN